MPLIAGRQLRKMDLDPTTQKTKDAAFVNRDEKTILT